MTHLSLTTAGLAVVGGCLVALFALLVGVAAGVLARLDGLSLAAAVSRGAVACAGTLTLAVGMAAVLVQCLR
ncbi:hypothetical protein [Streptomyces sp. NPDC005760]|uniref:hypothetical protein n=1 Tax=Streptomyces sp. NPDC005760 TaxID=3156718 RepID=UPI0033E7B421